MDTGCTINRQVLRYVQGQPIHPLFEDIIAKILRQEEPVFWDDLGADTQVYVSDFFKARSERPSNFRLRICYRCSTVTSSSWRSGDELVNGELVYFCDSCRPDADALI
jgi:hypothetical protein